MDVLEGMTHKGVTLWHLLLSWRQRKRKEVIHTIPFVNNLEPRLRYHQCMLVPPIVEGCSESSKHPGHWHSCTRSHLWCPTWQNRMLSWDYSYLQQSWSIAACIDLIAPWIQPVLELTDSSDLPLYRRWKEKSKMVLYCLDLWGTMAMGEILSLGGRFFLMSPYWTTAE